MKASALIVQANNQPDKNRPAVIFLHSASSHKDASLEEAKTLALEGIVSILPEAPYGRPEWQVPRGLHNPEKEMELWETAADELSAWIDILLRDFQVGPSKIIFVGKNLGGGFGGFWLAKDNRIHAAIFSGAIPDLSTFWTTSPHPIAERARQGLDQSQLDTYFRVMSPTDLLSTLPSIQGLASHLQYGAMDNWITRSAVDCLLKRAQEPKSISWIDDDHDMKSPNSIKDRREWILNWIQQSDR